MQIAVVYVGAMRSFDRCFATHRWHVLRKLGPVSFFVSTVKDADTEKLGLIRTQFPGSVLVSDVVEAQPDCVAMLRAEGVTLPAEWVHGKHYTHEPYAISVHPQAVARQLWQLSRAWSVFGDALRNYDIIIRIRPDLWFHSADFTINPAQQGARVPWWGRFGGVNDRFAVLDPRSAEAYFDTFLFIKELMVIGCPIHPESLVMGSLELNDCKIDATLAAEFSTLRTNGEMRSPEISASDMAVLRL